MTTPSRFPPSTAGRGEGDPQTTWLARIPSQPRKIISSQRNCRGVPPPIPRRPPGLAFRPNTAFPVFVVYLCDLHERMIKAACRRTRTGRRRSCSRARLATSRLSATFTNGCAANRADPFAILHTGVDLHKEYRSNLSCHRGGRPRPSSPGKREGDEHRRVTGRAQSGMRFVGCINADLSNRFSAKHSAKSATVETYFQKIALCQKASNRRKKALSDISRTA